MYFCINYIVMLCQGQFASDGFSGNTDSNRGGITGVYVGVGMLVILCSTVAVGTAIQRRRRKYHRIAVPTSCRAEGENDNPNRPSGGLLLEGFDT